jgi:opacity protein-like surface antigen
VRGILNSRRYDGGEERGRDTDDQLFYSGGSWRTERSQFSIDGDYLRQSTSITEFEDTGNVRSDERKITRSIRPRYSYSLFEDIRLFVGAGYRDVRFPNGDPVNFDEFDVISGNAGVTYIIDELNSFTMTGYYQDQEVHKSPDATESVGGAIRYNRTLNERWRTFAGFGYRKSNFKTANNTGNIERDSDTGPIYEGGITYEQSEVETFNFSVTRALEPSVRGNVNDRLTFRANYSKQLSPRLTGVAEFFWLENESVNDDNQSDNREAWRSNIGFNYKLTEKWSLTSRYRHRYQKYLDRDNSSGADSDAILFGIRFNGQEKRI